MFKNNIIKIIRRWMFVYLLMILLTSTAEATIYYIDYQQGDDSNTGTTTSSSFKHCPGDPNATGNANIILLPGDIVVFKGGVIYSFPGNALDRIVINASGTSGNSIIFRSGQKHSPQWGSERAVIDCTNADINSGLDREGCIDMDVRSYITIEGFEIKNMPRKDWYAGLIAWTGNSGGHITIEDNLLHDANGHCIFIQGATSGANPGNFIILNNNAVNALTHLIATRYGVDNVLIEGNILDKAGGNPYNEPDPAGNCIGILWFQSTHASTDIIIRNNDMNDTTTVPNKSLVLLQQNVTNITIEKNYLHGRPAVSAIDIIGNYTNLTIRNNVFHVFPALYEGIVRFRTGLGSGYGISNNIRIYNNTFVSTPRYDGIIYFHRGDNPDPAPYYTNVDIRNNIFDTTDGSYTYSKIIYVGTDIGGANPLVQLSTYTSDYNIYNWGAIVKPFYWGAAGSVTFDEWKTFTLNEVHSKYATVSFLDRTNKNFKLLFSDTVAKDTGVMLDSFSDDYEGAKRPQGIAWDIGAFEYKVVPPNPPIIKSIQ